MRARRARRARRLGGVLCRAPLRHDDNAAILAAFIFYRAYIVI
ncbi:hypothetical protein C7S16_3297 [Burkholderia thailandensis]|uniref:Uncharacterized protein n=1 Tax=Burkholderia thailandensis TaxID=57975 RepID=A0AAW9D2R1_BURTH|nr:hypothetical protein [Burkholderia thailandensis]MDW9254651.1 hypothetical protein [Burkholderia thailandensis]